MKPSLCGLTFLVCMISGSNADYVEIGDGTCLDASNNFYDAVRWVSQYTTAADCAGQCESTSYGGTDSIGFYVGPSGTVGCNCVFQGGALSGAVTGDFGADNVYTGNSGIAPIEKFSPSSGVKCYSFGSGASCTARVLAVVDRTFVKFWNEQYQRSFRLIEKMITSYNGNVTSGGVSLAIAELTETTMTDLVTIDEATATDETSLMNLVTQKAGEDNGLKDAETGFDEIFGNHFSDLAEDDVNSFILLFSDGIVRNGRAIKALKQSRSTANQGLTANTTPKIICIQTWRITQGKSIFRHICDQKFIVDLRDQSDDDLAQLITAFTCPADVGGKLPDPCADSLIKKGGVCRKVKRNPTDGTSTAPTVGMCRWNKKTGCSLRSEFESLFN